MALKSIRDKIANITGSEVLGEANAADIDSTLESKSSKSTRTVNPRIKSRTSEKPKSKPSKSSKVSGANSANRNKTDVNYNKDVKSPAAQTVNQNVKPERKANQVNIVSNAIEGYDDVLSILGIKEEVEVEVDFTSEDMDYIEFSQTTPLGFDFDEVTDFISRTKYTLHKLESTLSQRNRDIVTVASEVKKVEQKMMERNQERELDKMLGGMTEEERLIADNMDLKVEINNLEREKASLLRELEEARKDSLLVDELKEELAKLKKDTSIGHSTLPTMDESVSDPFDDMIKDIGGFYDE